MDKKLLFQALIKFIMGFLIIGLILFISAGTFNYYNGWLFIGLLFIPMLIVGSILMIKNPELLRKRLNSKEKENEQKNVLLFGLILFLMGFILAGINFRYSIVILPTWLVILGSIIFLLSYLMYAMVLKQNIYLSRTIEIQEKQKVIDNGLYGIIRHPMYTSTIFLFLSMTIVLGSVFSFIIFLIYPLILRKRILNEEKVLEENLEGYKEYKKKVKYRLIPFIW